jgi:putative spermidine/putrescine transport system permease protein
LRNAATKSAKGLTGPILMLPVAGFLAAFFLFPVINIVYISVTEPGFGIANYLTFVREPPYLSVLGRTFFVSFVVTASCALIAYPLAYVAARLSGIAGLILVVAIALSFWTSYLVRAFAWMVIFGRNGPLSEILNWFGITNQPQMLYTSFSMYVGLIHALVPYMMLTIYAVMSKIDRKYELAATNLGASPIVAFATVYFPLSLPGVVNGCTLVFVFCLGFYVTPELLGGSSDIMLPSMIGKQMNALLDWGLAGAMTTILIGSTLLILAIYNRFFGLNRLWG